jgi:cardiolipin synthase
MRARADDGWLEGNSLRLLENGEDYFPAVFSAIAQARKEVLLETFILFEDKVGLALHEVLLAAARRGVQVDVTIDGFGSPTLSSHFISSLTDAGVRLHVFDPPPKLSRRLQPFRRLHRKIVVIDGEIGFIGGINYSADHLIDFGPEAKQDYAAEVRGPIVAHMRREAQRIIAPARGGGWWWRQRQARTPSVEQLPAAGSAHAKLVTRDNHRHRDDIERHYRLALHSAQREVIIANAYFFPGYRLVRAMQRAARRGVDVHLILQGQPDIMVATWAARLIYHHLLKAGVHIHEYCKRPIHAKVAVVDDEWATIGSSNLDPLSLALNLEANLMVRDKGFAQALRDKLSTMRAQHCKEIGQDEAASWRWGAWLGYPVFHMLRHFPRWATLLPRHRPLLTPAQESTVVAPEPLQADVEPWRWEQVAAYESEAAPEAACVRQLA